MTVFRQGYRDLSRIEQDEQLDIKKQAQRPVFL
jgi:hypothetical protein